MHKFMTHEPLASGLFNKSFNSGKGQWAAWAGELLSSHHLLQLLTQRMGNDYSQMAPKMRKVYSMKDVVTRFECQNSTPPENIMMGFCIPSTHRIFTLQNIPRHF